MRNQHNIFIFLLLIVLSSCCFDKGSWDASNSINEAKEKNVLIAEYIPNISPVLIDSIVNIEIEKVWLEYKWDYQCKFVFFKRIVLVDSTRTKFIVKAKINGNHGRNFLIVKDTLDGGSACCNYKGTQGYFTKVDIPINQDSVFFYIIRDFKTRELLHRFEFHKVDKCIK